MSDPFISVVTPFFNTAKYLAQCIESVLAQSYSAFEYVLVDNCSTDGSTEIAQEYARRDQRIRFIRRERLLPQVANYNGALAAISRESKFCKIVQADDYIFPDCLSLMVRAFEQSDSIGLVGAYDLKADIVRGSGFPFSTSKTPGKEVGRLYLRNGVFPFGSPTSVMYRSSLVREKAEFFQEGLLHEDTEKCMEILTNWDFGFVHQVLAFLRADNESISAAFRALQPTAIDRYIIVQKFADKFLDSGEAISLKKREKANYYSILATEALRGPKREFWDHHKKGLKTLGEPLDWAYLARKIIQNILWNLGNPLAAIVKVPRLLTRRRRTQ